jgi:hypothetical protein
MVAGKLYKRGQATPMYGAEEKTKLIWYCWKYTKEYVEVILEGEL